MRVLAFFLFFAHFLFGANIISSNISEKNESVEMKLSLDAPFDGYIEQNAAGANVVLKISNVTIPSSKDDTLSNNSIISRIVSAKDGANGAVIALTTKKDISLEAIKEDGGKIMTLKFLSKSAEANLSKAPFEPLKTTAPSAKSDEDSLGWRFAVMVFFLLFLIAVTLYIKKKALLQGGSLGFKNPLSKPEKAAANAMDKDELYVLTQSSLDPSNKLMLVECNEIKYLLLVGSTNLVIDRYCDKNANVQDEEFKKALAENERKLTEFLKPPKAPPPSPQPLSNFEEYRIKAEGDI